MCRAYNEKGKRETTKMIELSSHLNIRKIKLQIPEEDTIKQTEMKEKVRKEYLRRTSKLLETKHNSRNLIKGINIWAVSFIRCSGSFLNRKREDIIKIDHRTRRLAIMHKDLYQRNNTDSMWQEKKEHWGLCWCTNTRIQRIYKQEQWEIDSSKCEKSHRNNKNCGWCA